MSSGKTVRFQISAENARVAAERERRALAQAQAVWQEACDNCETLRRDISQACMLYGGGIAVTAPQPSSVAGHRSADFQAVTVRLNMDVAAARDLLRSQIASVRAASVLGPLSASTRAEQLRISHATPGTSAAGRPTIRQQVEQELGKLDADTDSDVRTSIEARACAIAADANESRARLSLKALHHDVGSANRAVAATRTRAGEIMALRSSLLGLGTTAAHNLIRLLDQLQASSSPLPESVHRSAEAAIAQAATEANGRYALQTALSCMAEMGLIGEPGFETQVAAGVPSQVSRRSWAGHAVRVGFDASKSSVSFDVVPTRTAQPKSADGRKIQEEFCGVYDRLHEAMKNQGIELTTTRRIEPGRLVAAADTADDEEETAPRIRQIPL